MVFGFLFLAQTETNPPTNSKSVFYIRFHLYIHDYVLDKPIGTPTSRVNTYVPPIWAYSYIWWFSVTFFWLKRKLILQLTQNLCFNIRFHLYIHDHVLDERIGTPTSRVNTYVPPIWAYSYIWWFSVTFFWLKRKLILQLTQNLCFNIRFHLYIHDHVLDEPIGTPTSRVNTYVPPI